MKAQATQASDTRIDPIYVLVDGALILDAPLQTAWPQVLNFASWQNYSIVQHISGEPGRVGEVLLLKKEEGTVPAAAYCARTIKLEPGRRVVWKTFRDNVEYFGIVEFRTEEVADKTRFSWNCLYEYPVPDQFRSNPQEFQKQQQENVAAMFSSILPKLKALVEKKS